MSNRTIAAMSRNAKPEGAALCTGIGASSALAAAAISAGEPSESSNSRNCASVTSPLSASTESMCARTSATSSSHRPGPRSAHARSRAAR